MNLNNDQIRAVSHLHGPMLVLAGPGSGKTTVIIQRLINLIQHGVRPDSILTVTFSKAAANELKSRFPSSTEASPVFGTFHSIFYNILKYSTTLGRVRILSPQIKLDFLRSEINKFQIEIDDENRFYSDLSSCISAALTSPDRIIRKVPALLNPRIFYEIINDYVEYKTSSGQLDFDDILIQCMQVLTSDASVLGFWQRQFSYIMVDEFQDINPIQYEIINMLAAPENNIFVVGDDDQSIYGFRGASPSILRDFLHDHPKASRVDLSINYRCHPEIIKASSEVISMNVDRVQKNIISDHAHEYGSDSDPVLTSNSKINPDETNALPHLDISHFPDRRSECEAICRKILEIQKHGGHLSDIAILQRNNSEAGLLTAIMAEYGIPFKHAGASANLSSHFIYRDLQAYMRLASDYPSKCQREDLLRIMNKPVRYLKRESMVNAHSHMALGVHNKTNTSDMSRAVSFKSQDPLSSMRQYYQGNPKMISSITKLEKHLKIIKSLSPFAACAYILNVIGYKDYLRKYSEEKNISPDQLMKKCDEICELMSLHDSINLLLTSHDGPKKGDTNHIDTDDAVNIMTMHASKGLEFEIVFLPTLNDEIIPGKAASRQDRPDSGSQSDTRLYDAAHRLSDKHHVNTQIEEERRLLYVAMTRAKRSLMISYVDRIGTKPSQPSRFIDCLLRQLPGSRYPS